LNMSQRLFGQSNLLARPRRAHGLLLGGASLLTIAFAMPVRAQTVITYSHEEDRSTALAMTQDTVGNVGLDEFATQSGLISGDYKFIKAGWGELTLSGNNAYSGGTDLNMGSLRLRTQTALGTGTLTMADGTRLIAESSTGSTFTLANAIQLDGVGEVRGSTSIYNQVDLTGVISGAGRLAFTGRGTLSGNNTYSGGTDVSGGSLLFIMNANSLGTGRVTLANEAILAFNSASYSNDIVLAGANGRVDTLNGGNIAILNGVVSGGGQLIKTGSGEVVLTAANTYSGDTSINGGKLVAQHDQALGSGTVYINEAILAYGNGVNISNVLRPSTSTYSRLVVAAGETATQSGNITGHPLAGSYIKLGAGELVLLGAASYGGNTNLQEGMLTAGAENVLASTSMHVLESNTRLNLLAHQEVGGIQGSGTIDLGDNTLLLNGTRADSIFSGELIGGGQSGLEKSGIYRLYLDGDNESYAGSLLGLSGDVIVRGDYSGLKTHIAGGGLSSGGTTTGRLGDVSVSDATLYGQSGSQLTMDSLSMTEFATVHAALGVAGAPTLFKINGNLTLDGALDVEDIGGFGPGVYRLFDYGGTLTDNGLDIGGVPTGYTAANLAVQTSVAGQVNLVTSGALAGETLFWDGSNSGLWNNGRVDGGNGFWRPGENSFTTIDGTVNGEQNPNPGFVVFGGQTGTVTVENDKEYPLPQVTGMQFASNGYRIAGDSVDLAAGDAIIRVGDGTAAGAGYTATISNELTGAGKLIKTDLGKLVLEGENTHSGGTEVRQGTLQVDGTIGDVVVGAAGRLGGNGTVGAAVVSGTITGGKSMGVLTVDGDLTMEEGSTLQVKVDAAGNSDRIDVTGMAYLNGGRVATLASGGNYADQTSYTILSAEGGIDGTFADVTSNLAFLDAALSYSEKDVQLMLTRNGTIFENVGNTRNQIATGSSVEGLGAGNALYDRVLTLSAADARFAFDQLSGEIHASAKGVLLNDSRFVRDAANARISAAFGGVGVAALPLMAHDDNGAPVPPTTDRLAFWSEAFGSWGSARGDGNAASLDGSTGGLLMGGDAAFGESWRAGLLAGYSQTSFDVNDRTSSGKSDNYHLGLYSGGQWGAFGLRGGAAYSWNRLDTGRSVSFPGFEDRLTAKYNAGTAQIFGEAGYRIDTAGASFEPFANLAYVSLHTDGFKEHGGAAALKATGTTTDATFTTLGIRAQSNFVLGGVAAIARGTLGWRHASGDVQPLADVAFAGGGAFTVAGTPIARDAAVIEAGLDFAVSPLATLGLSYAGQLASDASDNGFKADLSIRF
jgi:outer membrane autotransporter protein